MFLVPRHLRRENVSHTSYQNDMDHEPEHPPPVFRTSP
jgi:hypothetical protein